MSEERIEDVHFSDLLGETLTAVEVRGKEEIVLRVDSEYSYVMRHEQDCCEEVTVEDVAGDWADLIGEPIRMAEESISHNPTNNDLMFDSATWTFYKLGTIKGYVTIRWLGVSNGYYSERVSTYRVWGDTL